MCRTVTMNLVGRTIFGLEQHGVISLQTLDRIANVLVTISDNGEPPLSSTTRVVIAVEDVNDHAPQFKQNFYKVNIPESTNHDLPLFQNTTDEVEVAVDLFLENGTWETFDSNTLTGDPILRIRAEDNGTPKRSQTTRVSIQVSGIPKESPHPPTIKSSNQEVEITESDSVWFLVALIQAVDEDGDMLWYNIVDINDHRPNFSEKVYSVDISENVEKDTEILRLQATDEDEDPTVFYSLHAARDPASLDIFRVDSMSGAVYLNEKLDRETIEEHILTVMVKDQGTPSKRNYARVIVTVHDHNDHSPEFTSTIIQGKVYETSSVGAVVVQVCAIDRDRGENARITYTITSGNVGNVFNIDPSLGTLSLSKQLDLGMISEYMLIVKATDAGSPSLSSTIPVHIMITMADNAPPRFSKSDYAAEIYENQPVGTFVKHLEARSTSSLFFEVVSGNTNDMFFINPSTGVITTKQQLDYELNKFYNLSVEATNMAGAKARCCVIVHILDRNDNAPRFMQASYSGSITESAAVGSLVLTNTSSPLVIKAQDIDSELNSLLSYDIVESMPRKFFRIDSSTGAIRTVMALDHETTAEFNFNVKVSDLGKPQLSSETVAKVHITVLDINDCPPQFLLSQYNCTLLLPTYQGVAIVQVNATDPDSDERTVLRYDIIDGNKDNVFTVDSNSGVVTVTNEDNLKQAYNLHLRVSDGKFSSVTQVNIKVERSENSGLKFQKDLYEGTIMENSTKIYTVGVVNVLGSALNEHVIFSIMNPNDMFEIGPTSGAIRTTGQKFDREIKDYYELIVQLANTLVVLSSTAEDGEIEVRISVGFIFLSLSLPQAMSDDNSGEKPRVAHVIVNVTILDINDNCPMFVNLPYYAVVSVDAQKGDVITKVAI
uniref:Cadherin domain-containing protein n=1 Tax=Timema shepardi TaxID=629360 RepID=A0A7R9ALY6_TIMSH|nr:unnamed protein product [Timema shepardi]